MERLNRFVSGNKNFRSYLEVTSDVFMFCVGRSSVALCPRTKDIFKQILLQGKEIFEEIFHLFVEANQILPSTVIESA